MKKIDLTEEEVRDAYDDGKVVETRPWKWGTQKDVVFQRDGKNYLVTVECHSQEGLQAQGGGRAIEVKQEERTITVWVPA